MKILILLTALIALTNCVSTQGKSDLSNKSKEPYILHFNGSKNDLITNIKPILAINGFAIENEDTAAGILITKQKPLADDEKFSADFAMAMAGLRVNNQLGYITFIFNNISDSVLEIKMLCRIEVKGTYNQNIYKSSEINTSDITIQGHPFPMKFRHILTSTGKYY